MRGAGQFLLAICEGNFCTGGRKGRQAGNGRIIVSQLEMDNNNHSSCRYLCDKTLKGLPLMRRCNCIFETEATLQKFGIWPVFAHSVAIHVVHILTNACTVLATSSAHSRVSNQAIRRSEARRGLFATG